jgi:hypothetical protein
MLAMSHWQREKSLPAGWARQVSALLLSCSAADAAARPSMGAAAEALAALLADEMLLRRLSVAPIAPDPARRGLQEPVRNQDSERYDWHG